MSTASIRIVLLLTYHPGNIGAVSRAMKTMGLNDLYLVRPRKFPAEEATNRAAGAVDVLNKATIVSTLEEAIADCTQVFATTARQQRSYTRPQKNCEQAVQWIKHNPNEKVAIVFGRERMGMSTDDINLCQQMLYIPGNPEYDVLNLASAVQIVCYELFKQLNQLPETPQVTQLAEYATQQEVDNFYEHLQLVLEETGFLRSKHPGEAMLRLRQFINRAQPNAKEIRMLRGLMASLTKQ